MPNKPKPNRNPQARPTERKDIWSAIKEISSQNAEWEPSWTLDIWLKEIRALVPVSPHSERPLSEKTIIKYLREYFRTIPVPLHQIPPNIISGFTSRQQQLDFVWALAFAESVRVQTHAGVTRATVKAKTFTRQYQILLKRFARRLRSS